MDVVVISYVLSTFITKFEDLVTILRQSKKMMKDDGYLFITDFSWVRMPKEDLADYGMYTNYKDLENGPPNFEIYQFFIDKAPNDPFEIFNIPNDVMFKAGYEAGFTSCDFTLQYPDPCYA